MAVISKTMQDAFCQQIKNEMYSAYLYLSMSAWFEAQDLPGFAHWMKAQFIEEEIHALKMTEFVLDRDGAVTLLPIDQPPSTFASALDVFEKTLAHEQTVTALINDLYATAIKENDTASQVLLHWFINEQVEEEKNADLIMEQLKAVGTMRGLLIMLDGHMDERKASLSVG
jgi:ferritin